MVELETTDTIKRSSPIPYPFTTRCDYNKTKYQEENPNIETFGDHVCHYLHCFLNLNMDLKIYHDYMVELRNKIGHSYDYIVALWGKDILNK